MGIGKGILGRREDGEGKEDKIRGGIGEYNIV
jgi:hypothetical protein